MVNLSKKYMLNVLDQVCPEHFKKFEEISLSRRTIARRIEAIDEDLKSQLTRRVPSFQLFHSHWMKALTSMTLQEILPMESMKDTTTGEDIFKCLENALHKMELPWQKMTSEKSWSTEENKRPCCRGRFQQGVDIFALINTPGDVMPWCIGHETRGGSNCKKVLILSGQEINFNFLEMKGNGSEYPQLRISQRLSDLPFPLDLFEHMEELRTQNFMGMAFFLTKCICSEGIPDIEFTRRFGDFQKLSGEFDIFQSPITSDFEKAPAALQLEFIDLQCVLP
ncbi:hypothetical protein RF11_12103 [Thelohanellus kitauei]|uniref:Uncharacterized protein n=1 Tax=Thelohanellus kitauei TaxID=669202 RepID=A0A0C2NIK9_THEKT|nr:hypothetical protein RF11_12103 [Thelohanellus kitauei]